MVGRGHELELALEVLDVEAVLSRRVLWWWWWWWLLLLLLRRKSLRFRLHVLGELLLLSETVFELFDR